MLPKDGFLTLYATQPHACSYLADKKAVTSFVDPSVLPTKQLYSELIQQGFRRSGNLIYRPHCPSCKSCISIRVAVNEFTPNRSQKRAKEKNHDLLISCSPAKFCEEHFFLYQRYQRLRHAEGDMKNHSEQEYENFLFFSGVESWIYEFRLKRKLVAVAIVDATLDGLSAVYTFFEPTYQDRSLGIFAILTEIEAVKQKGLNWLYLGYWIEDCRKMAYKIQFRPAQKFWNGMWVQASETESRLSY